MSDLIKLQKMFFVLNIVSNTGVFNPGKFVQASLTYVSNAKVLTVPYPIGY